MRQGLPATPRSPASATASTLRLTGTRRCASSTARSLPSLTSLELRRRRRRRWRPGLERPGRLRLRVAAVVAPVAPALRARGVASHDRNGRSKRRRGRHLAGDQQPRLELRGPLSECKLRGRVRVRQPALAKLARSGSGIRVVIPTTYENQGFEGGDVSAMVPNTFYTWDDARTVTSSFWYKGNCATANCTFDVMAQFCPKDGSGNPCCGGCPGSTAEVTSIDLGHLWVKATFTFQSTPGVPIHRSPSTSVPCAAPPCTSTRSPSRPRRHRRRWCRRRRQRRCRRWRRRRRWRRAARALLRCTLPTSRTS